MPSVECVTVHVRVSHSMDGGGAALVARAAEEAYLEGILRTMGVWSDIVRGVANSSISGVVKVVVAGMVFKREKEMSDSNFLLEIGESQSRCLFPVRKKKEKKKGGLVFLEPPNHPGSHASEIKRHPAKFALSFHVVAMMLALGNNKGHESPSRL